MKWFFIDESITDGERRQGPYSIDEIHDFVNQGKITDNTLVWHTGEPDWKTWKEASLSFENVPPEPTPSAEQEELLADTIKALESIVEENRRRTLRFAGFIVRAAAYIIDNAILGIFGGLALFMLSAAGMIDFGQIQQAADLYISNPASTENLNALLAVPGMSTFITIWSIIQTLYFVVFHALYSATPGKMLLHIHVETADGNRLTWGASIARYLCSVLTQFTTVIYGLGYLIVCIDPKRRALHDWIARTFVVFDTPKAKTAPNDDHQGN